jgi:hypothetical protein
VPVRNVSNRFRDGTESGGGFDPSHWKRQRNCNEWFLTRASGQDYRKLGGGICRQPDAIETVADVDFVHVDGAVARVCMSDAEQQLL